MPLNSHNQRHSAGVLGDSLALSKITLGTVQLGMNYGVANATGQPNETQVHRILDTAFQVGIRTFDTAREYGTSEDRIGSWLSKKQSGPVSVVTKLAPIGHMGPEDRLAAIATSLERSKSALRQTTLDCVLVHRQTDILCEDVGKALLEARDRGQIGSFGASVYDPSIAKQIIRNVEGCTALQVPLSIADQRFLVDGVVSEAAAQGIVVFARSSLLQGALMMAANRLPAHLQSLAAPLQKLDGLAREAGVDRLAILLDSVGRVPGLSSIVLGAEQPSQVLDFGRCLTMSALVSEVASVAVSYFRELPDECVEVRKWPRP